MKICNNSFSWLNINNQQKLGWYPDILFIKHDSSIFRQSSSPVDSFMEEPSQFLVGHTAKSLTCSIMEQPHTGLDDCLNILLSCFRKKDVCWYHNPFSIDVTGRLSRAEHPLDGVSGQSVEEEGEEDDEADPGGNCIKIGLPGKSILGDYFQANVTSQRPFLLVRISFPGRPIFIQFVPEEDLDDGPLVVVPDDVANGLDGVQEPHEGGVGTPEINIIRMPGGDAECRIHRKRNNGPNGPHCPVWPIPVQHSASHLVCCGCFMSCRY